MPEVRPQGTENVEWGIGLDELLAAKVDLILNDSAERATLIEKRSRLINRLLQGWIDTQVRRSRFFITQKGNKMYHLDVQKIEELVPQDVKEVEEKRKPGRPGTLPFHEALRLLRRKRN
jgi:hypothetical protein